MKSKLFKVWISIILLITLAGLDFIFLGNQIILALYEGLEEQKTATNVRNVIFDAYFKEGEAKKHSKQATISQGENLMIDIAVENVGVLESGKIKIENANFTIDKARVKDENIKAIQEETNEIELNQMASGKATITLPIKFEKQKANTLNYFDQESQIKLIGEYKQSDTNTKEVKGQIATRLTWTEEAQIKLAQEIEKYINLGENGILLQQKVALSVDNNTLPIEKQTIKIAVPELEEKMPTKIVVLHNGSKLEETKYQFDSTNKILEIKQEQNNNQIQWGTGEEEYKIIYTYNQEIGYKQRTIQLETESRAKLYTRDEDTKTETKQIEISPKGNIVSLEKITTPSISKGYMYANTNNTIDYQEELKAEISNVEGIGQTIKLTENTNFINTRNEKYNTNQSITYKKIQINKNNMLDILGQEGNIQIQKEDGTMIGYIDANTQADENGNLVISSNQVTTKLQIITTKPQKEGSLAIHIEKSISGETGYTKEDLKSFITIENETNATINETETATLTKNIELQEPITQAKLSISNENLSTLDKNENIQLNVTLKSDDAKYNLWKNPYLYLKLPEEIEEIKVNSTQILYGDNLEIEKARLIKSQKAIEIQMRGEQLEFQSTMNEGIQIIINADITLAKTTPSKTGKIELTYTNENIENTEQKTEVDIRINSKFGAVLYNQLESYNKENEKLETISQETLIGNLDAQEEATQANAHIEIINNYEETMNEVNTIISLPNTENVGKEKSTINMPLAKAIQTPKDKVEIYYATKDIEQNSEEWTKELPNLKDIKKMKVVAKELQPGETIPIDYSIQIPENMEEEQIAYQETALNYEYQGKPLGTYSALKLTSPEGESNQLVNINNDGVKVKVSASTTGKEIKNGDAVYEGQTIRYNIDITNNTGSDLNNVSLEGIQTDAQGNANVTFFHVKEIEEWQPITAQNVMVKRYMEDESLQSMKFTKEKIAAGQTATFQYEFTVNTKKAENETTKGTLVIKADGKETKTEQLMENKIEKAELKLITAYGYNEEMKFEANAEVPFINTVENLTDNKLENIVVDINLPEGTSFNQANWENTEKYELVKYENRKITIKIIGLEPKEKLKIGFYASIGEVDSQKLEQQYAFSCQATINGKTYYSNQIEKTAVQLKSKLEVKQEADKTEEYVKEGDSILFTTTITNQSARDVNLVIEDSSAMDILQLQEAYIQKNGQKVNELQQAENSLIYTEYQLKANETIQLKEKVKVGENEEEIEEFEHYINVYNSEQSDESNIITYKLTNSSNPNNPEDPSNPNNPGNPSEEEKNGEISGKAWIDSNKDGIKDNNGIANMEVLLMNPTDGKIEASTKTNANGEYTFQNLKTDGYLVAFKYNINQYTVTKYKVEGATEANNSDVISRQLKVGEENLTVAVTDKIDIKGNKVENIDAGFYENQIFDLSLKKSVRKVITQSTRGTRMQEYNDTSLAKVELHAKEIQGANVIIEYAIKITNEGEIAGFVNDVIDYLPSELTFSSEMNKEWYITNGKLHNQTLTNEIIKPGETKELTLTLTKTMSSDTTGTIRNTAEIGASSNDLGISDYDSTPGNKQEKEDDISSADVIVSISTGAITIIITIISVMLGLVLIGVILFQLRKITVKHKEV